MKGVATQGAGVHRLTMAKSHQSQLHTCSICCHTRTHSTTPQPCLLQQTTHQNLHGTLRWWVWQHKGRVCKGTITVWFHGSMRAPAPRVATHTTRSPTPHLCHTSHPPVCCQTPAWHFWGDECGSPRATCASVHHGVEPGGRSYTPAPRTATPCPQPYPRTVSAFASTHRCVCGRTRSMCGRCQRHCSDPVILHTGPQHNRHIHPWQQPKLKMCHKGRIWEKASLQPSTLKGTGKRLHETMHSCMQQRLQYTGTSTRVTTALQGVECGSVKGHV
jgi:hypothetical protein